jgi:hypothetical protein
MATKREVIRNHLAHYLKVSRKKKGAILDRLSLTLGMKRKAVIQSLSRMRKRDPWKTPPQKRGRKETYGPAVIAALRTVWETAGEICGELLFPILSEYTETLKRDRDWKHDDTSTRLLLSMSEGTIKKRVGLFQKARRRRKGKSSTRPSNVKEIIPLFTGPWEGKPPGYGQMDTVVHCGMSLKGDLVFTLQFVDSATYWSIRRAQWNKGETATMESLSVIRNQLPFPLLGAHSDSGGEFINRVMKQWCEENGIEQTRSRPYRKNDNAFVEERNGHVVRKQVGYRRLDVRETVPALNAFYEVLNLYSNHFIPTRRCVRKERIGSKYVRRYEKAETPYSRVLRNPLISERVKSELRTLHTTLNPLKLKKDLDRLRRNVFDIQKASGTQELSV